MQRRLPDVLMRKVDHMVFNPIRRDRRIPKGTPRDIIKREL